jgi:hypothetical protein
MTWKLIEDKRPYCLNGWAGTKRKPGCDYTGGHGCDKLANHKGRCRCVCGATTGVNRAVELMGTLTKEKV